MNRFSLLQSCIRPAIIVSIAVSSTHLAASTVSVQTSTSTALSFHVDLNHDLSLAPKIAGISGETRASRIAIPIDDTSSIDAAVVCFIAPVGATPQIVKSDRQLGESVSAASLPPSFDRNLFETKIVAPINVRGLRIGKVVIPAIAFSGGEIHRVVSADISVIFSGASDKRGRIASGILDQELLNLAVNGEQASSWYSKLREKSNSEVYDPFAQSQNWVRIAVKNRGVYKITRSDLTVAGVNVSSIDPTSFRLFHAGGKILPTTNSAPRDSLAECAITVFGEEDGVFSGDDFMMFYANGPDYWDWSDSLIYRLNPYSDRNVFYLTYGGSFTNAPKRMAVRDGQNPVAGDTLAQYTDHIHLEEEDELSHAGDEIEDYFHWYWSSQSSLPILFNLPTPATSRTNSLRVHAFASNVTMLVNNFVAPQVSSKNADFFFESDQLKSGANQITLTLQPDFRGSLTDFVEVNLQRDLQLSGGSELLIYGESGGSGHNYSISGGLASPFLLDVSDLRSQALITSNLSGNRLFFSTETSQSQGREFALVNAADLKKPFSIVSTQIDDIRSTLNSADLIIITHDNFYNQALEFAAYREARDTLRVRVVRISDVYAQFSGGMLDPVAIRDFLGYAFRNWSGRKPSFCLLAGDGAHDFRNRTPFNAVNYVPPFVVDNDSTISDENFAFFGNLNDLDSDDSYPNDRGADMVIARWPVKTTSEFQAVADKMEQYEVASNTGSWRNLITLVADDQHHPGTSEAVEAQHTQNSELLAESSIPPIFNLNKIYGIDYPYSGAEKPEQREAIIRAMNSGTLLVNYVGHGNQDLWADEHIFRRTQDISRLSNGDRLPLIFNASCSIGFFDDPESEGMAEDFLRYPNGGAIGTVSATRLVTSRPNFDFNVAAFDQLFGDRNYTIAEAVFVAKLLRQGLFGARENDRKYIYIGDPMTRIAVAQNRIKFVTFDPDSFVGLTVTKLSGAIESAGGTPQSDFNGTAQVSIFDNEKTRTVQFSQFFGISYKQNGSEIYRGRVAVADGKFDLRFVVPKDITYGGRKARISCYATGASSGASGYIAPIAIGSINKDINDTSGPIISIYFSDDPSRSDGSTVGQNASITIDLSDSLGINLSGDIGHAIELTIDDGAVTYALTDSFVYFPGSYQRGKAVMNLPTLSSGEHHLKVKAWDSANNSSLAEIGFRVGSSPGLEITDLMCFPNPVKSECQFSYSLSEAAKDVTLRVFTLSGLEIFRVGNLPVEVGYHDKVDWNVRDSDGDAIASGVYIVQLSARASANSGNESVATSKLVVMK